MPGKNKTPLLGWHPPAELSAWVRAEAERRDVKISVILTEAVETYRAQCGLPGRLLRAAFEGYARQMREINDRSPSEQPGGDHERGEQQARDDGAQHGTSPG